MVAVLVGLRGPGGGAACGCASRGRAAGGWLGRGVAWTGVKRPGCGLDGSEADGEFVQGR
ncbi:hypothetical protein GCM10009601_17430 [Streptomyces thermospinosisporus]|uniref:Uncharacterized protein n=1 Tax=Streptomyces thermospinosisporus TaxID=161482 RepID=A0ABP4JED0_9ACTN